MATEKKKLSLVDPDFTGLRSVARLGHEKKWWSKFMGTVALSIFLYTWIGGLFTPFFILILLYLQYYTAAVLLTSFITIPYFVSVPPQPWICRFYMKYGAHYFDGGCTLCIENKPDLDQVRKCNSNICSCHPHGMMCIGYWLTGGVRFRAVQDLTDKDNTLQHEFIGPAGVEFFEDKPPYTGLVVNVLANAPFFNLFIGKLTGCVASASNQNMKGLMKKREGLGILPGGFNEATIHRKGENVIYIRNRKGFIKYCLQYGYRICPVYFFGECETYHNLFYSQHDNEWIIKLKYWFNQNKIPTVFPMGPYWYSPILPYGDTGIHAVYSANTRCEHIENPTREKIDEFHEWYMEEMAALFDRHKWRFGYDDNVKLKIV